MDEENYTTNYRKRTARAVLTGDVLFSWQCYAPRKQFWRAAYFHNGSDVSALLLFKIVS